MLASFAMISSFLSYGMNGNSSMGGMSMTLHVGEREFILFNFWKTGSALGLAASMLIIFLMCILYEAIKALRIFLARVRSSNRAYARQQRRAASPCVPVQSISENADTISSDSMTFAPLLRISSAAARMFTLYRFTQALLYAVQATLAYLLMLVVMTFNVWLLFSVILGEAVGYFLFSGEPVITEHLNDACC
ncbi:putative low affinity copper uptake protein 2 [Toxocara canis]|uniref:Copper transport protein n=2 Tax=Toxocara canis TaxID=6265 RepID=A0A0B2VAZ3_TOXCA|nr:putative low affinity copper uptake protein 2 [Toxocara canis]VDM41847.1 unnamed protein product [Toxocara canis]